MSLFARDQFGNDDNENKSKCGCCGRGWSFLSHYRVGCVLACLGACVCAIFIVGYFLGQHAAVEQFSVKMAQDSLSDRINASLITLYDSKAGQEIAQDDDQESAEASQEAVAVAENEQKDQRNTLAAPVAKSRYYAQIAGFGNEKAARSFVQRMKDKNIHVMVKPRHTKNGRGKQVTWYQIVSETFDSRQTVDALADTLRRQEHINTVRVITC